MYKLLIEDEEGKTTVVPVALNEITIGRKDGNIIRLTDRNISRFHAKFTISGSEVIVEDLDSYNGIKINGDKIIGRSVIKEGDLVEVGNYRLRLKSDAEVQPVAVVSKIDPSVPAGFIEEVRTQPPVKETFDTPVPGVAQPPVAQNAEVPPAGARLVSVAGPREGVEYPLTKGVVTLGRAEDNDIAIDHYSLARNHAKIVFEGGVFKILDLHSANGVLVNGEQFARTGLKNGDLIGLGQAKLKFFDGSAASSPVPVASVPPVSAVPAQSVPDRVQEPAPADVPPAAKVEEAPRKPISEPLNETHEAEEAGPFKPSGRSKTGLIAAIVGGAAFMVAAIVYFSMSNTGQPAEKAPAVALVPAETKQAAMPPPAVQQPAPEVRDPAPKTVPVPIAEKPVHQAAPLKTPVKAPDAAAPAKTDPITKKTAVKPEVPPKVPPTQRSAVQEPAAGKEPGYYELYNDGNKMYLQNNVLEAIALFEKSIKANNRFPQAHRSLGIAYAKVGQRDKAAAEYRIYLLLAPNAPDRSQLEKIIRDFEQFRQ
jgi:pSer/pThr/pTyr-binding forkhead associated (FHA) protein